MDAECTVTQLEKLAVLGRALGPAPGARVRR